MDAAQNEIPSPFWGGLVPRIKTEKARYSFSEEKEAKRRLFLRLRQDVGHDHATGSCIEIEVFCFFSSAYAVGWASEAPPIILPGPKFH
jgi:hypothetical protein